MSISHSIGCRDCKQMLWIAQDEMADAMGLMLIWLKENGHLEDGK